MTLDNDRPEVPAGCRVFAIGDIHGRADLLGRMAEMIERDLQARPPGDAVTIFLGDYVDRGPASAQVLGRLAAGDFPTPVRTLRGNHEDILLQLLRGAVDLDYYDQVGGEATLASYGVDLRDLARMSRGAVDRTLRAAVPDHHRAFLEQTELSTMLGDYFFVHAGVRPGVALDRQQVHDMMWIRDEFLRSTYDFGKIVVHGHTPVRAPDVRSNGINIDTQAFASGILTCLVLESVERRFMQARM